jgi:hypothetical protein
MTGGARPRPANLDWPRRRLIADPAGTVAPRRLAGLAARAGLAVPGAGSATLPPRPAYPDQRGPVIAGRQLGICSAGIVPPDGEAGVALDLSGKSSTPVRGRRKSGPR